jgi:ketopantoate hydroxymethyltransferase
VRFTGTLLHWEYLLFIKTIMKKYMVLYMAPVEEFEKMMAADKATMDANMQTWNEWMGAHTKDFVDPGMALGATLRVTPKGVSKVKNEVGGYSIVQAESHEAAAELFRDSPNFDFAGAWIDVIECVDMGSL